MTQFSEEYETSQNESDIILLGKSKSRHDMIDKGLTRSHKLTFNRIFGDYRREVELYSIAKSI